MVEHTRHAVFRKSACRPVKFNLTYRIRASELPSSSGVVSRGHHDHDNSGARSGRIWTLRQQATARAYVHSHSKPTVQGMGAIFSKDQSAESSPSQQPTTDWFERSKEDFKKKGEFLSLCMLKQRSTPSKNVRRCPVCTNHFNSVNVVLMSDGKCEVNDMVLEKLAQRKARPTGAFPIVQTLLHAETTDTYPSCSVSWSTSGRNRELTESTIT